MTDKHPRGLELDGLNYIFSRYPGTCTLLFIKREKDYLLHESVRKTERKPSHHRFAEKFECLRLPLVLSWYSHFCLVYRAIFIFYSDGMLLSQSSVGHVFQFEI